MSELFFLRRRWLVVARGHGETEPIGRFHFRRVALMFCRHCNKRADNGWLCTIERLTPPCEEQARYVER